MEDAIKGMTYQIVEKLLPAIKWLIGGFIDAANAVDLIINGQAKLDKLYQDHEKEMRLLAKSYKDYIIEMKRTADLTGKSTTAEALRIALLEDEAGLISEVAESEGLLSEAQFEANKATQAQISMMEADALALEMAKQKTDELAKSIEDDLNVAFSHLNAWMKTTVEDENKKYNESMLAIKTTMQETALKIDELSKKKHLTPEQKIELEELRTAYFDQKAQYEENAKAHELATKKILFDILMQEAAMDGFTKIEKERILDVATQWGLINQEQKNATINAGLYLQGVITLDEYIQGMEDKTVNIDVNTNYNSYGDPTPLAGEEDMPEYNPPSNPPSGGGGNSGNQPDYEGMQAQGMGQTVFNRPTSMIVGDGYQPEIVSVTPLGPNGGMAGGVTINIANAQFDSESNYQKTLKRLAPDLQAMGRRP